ncbi:MAG: hypothetical protein R3B68_14880 [Phycisphaerales bacterium]
MRLRCEIPPDAVRRGIRWLEIEPADGGAYLFLYENIDAPCKYDHFFTSVEEALTASEESWSVARSDWHEVGRPQSSR